MRAQILSKGGRREGMGIRGNVKEIHLINNSTFLIQDISKLLPRELVIQRQDCDRSQRQQLLSLAFKSCGHCPVNSVALVHVEWP